ncbi:retrovirus-related pol polyprotein from transposon TNT 1-94 [Tanacetum coccineum]
MVGSARKPLDKSKETCFACGKLGYFQKECPSHKTSTPSYPSSNNSFNKSYPYTPSFNQTSSQNSSNHQKDYKGKYKGLKAEMDVLTKWIDDMTKGKNDEGSTKISAFMAIAKDEPSVRKADARLG